MKKSEREPIRKNKIYNSSKEQKRAAWRRWYEKVKNEPNRLRYNKWRKTQKMRD